MGNTVDRHGRDVSNVLRELTRNKCRVNWDKFRLGYVRLRMLGHILGGLTRAVDPVKLEAVD